MAENVGRRREKKTRWKMNCGLKVCGGGRKNNVVEEEVEEENTWRCREELHSGGEIGE